MTTWSSATIKVKEQLVGGPKLVTGEITVVSGDTGGDIDLSEYFAKYIKSVVGLTMVTSGTVLFTGVDITTVATTLTLTHSDPAAGATIYFAVIGQ
jgi:hypothetical protein